MNKILLANVISRTFDLYTLIPLSIVILASKSDTSLYITLKWMILFVIVLVLCPTIFLLALIREKKVGDWDISDRIQRMPVEIVALIFSFLLFAFCLISKAPIIFQKGSFIFYILTLCLVLVTETWKLSVHSLMITTTVCLLIVFFGKPFVPAILAILMVYWARLTLKKHTFPQLLVSSIISLIFTIGVLILY